MVFKDNLKLILRNAKCFNPTLLVVTVLAVRVSSLTHLNQATKDECKSERY